MSTMLHFSGARLILGSGVLAALVLTGCSDDPVSVDPVATVTKTSSTDNLQADAGTVVAKSPEVTLLRASGAKAVGETVTFTIEGGWWGFGRSGGGDRQPWHRPATNVDAGSGSGPDCLRR